MQKYGAGFEQHKTNQGEENNSVSRTPRAKKVRRGSTDDRILCSIPSTNNSNKKIQQINNVGCNNFSFSNTEIQNKEDKENQGDQNNKVGQTPKYK